MIASVRELSSRASSGQAGISCGVRRRRRDSGAGAPRFSSHNRSSSSSKRRWPAHGAVRGQATLVGPPADRRDAHPDQRSGLAGRERPAAPVAVGARRSRLRPAVLVSHPHPEHLVAEPSPRARYWQRPSEGLSPDRGEALLRDASLPPSSPAMAGRDRSVRGDAPSRSGWWPASPSALEIRDDVAACGRPARAHRRRGLAARIDPARAADARGAARGHRTPPRACSARRAACASQTGDPSLWGAGGPDAARPRWRRPASDGWSLRDGAVEARAPARRRWRRGSCARRCPPARRTPVRSAASSSASAPSPCWWRAPSGSWAPAQARRLRDITLAAEAIAAGRVATLTPGGRGEWRRASEAVGAAADRAQRPPGRGRGAGRGARRGARAAGPPGRRAHAVGQPDPQRRPRAADRIADAGRRRAGGRRRGHGAVRVGAGVAPDRARRTVGRSRWRRGRCPAAGWWPSASAPSRRAWRPCGAR